MLEVVLSSTSLSPLVMLLCIELGLRPSALGSRVLQIRSRMFDGRCCATMSRCVGKIVPSVS